MTYLLDTDMLIYVVRGPRTTFAFSLVSKV